MPQDQLHSDGLRKLSCNSQDGSHATMQGIVGARLFAFLAHKHAYSSTVEVVFSPLAGSLAAARKKVRDIRQEMDTLDEKMRGLEAPQAPDQPPEDQGMMLNFICPCSLRMIMRSLRFPIVTFCLSIICALNHSMIESTAFPHKPPCSNVFCVKASAELRSQPSKWCVVHISDAVPASWCRERQRFT